MAVNASRNDLASGAIFVAFGAYFALEAMRYEFGTPFRMGPGFMPIMLGGILVALGVAVAAGCTPYLAVEVAARWSPPGPGRPIRLGRCRSRCRAQSPARPAPRSRRSAKSHDSNCTACCSPPRPSS